MKRKNIRIAIQKDGRLMDDSLRLLESRGYKCPPLTDRKTITKIPDQDIEVLFVRQVDIPQYVQSGVADFGIIGSNILYEDDFDVNVVEELGFARCSLVIAVPNDSNIREISDLSEERIATSYPNSLKKALSQTKTNSSIIEIAGSVEVAPLLGLADAVCDITQTGDSLKANGLRIIEKILDSQAVLIESPFVNSVKTSFKDKFCKKIKVEPYIIDFDKSNGLVPAIIQDYKTNDVLMLGYMNKESLAETCKRKKVVFWSRSRKKLWMKGEESGNILELREIFIDCDQDTVLIKADLIGSGVCHTGNRTCFYTKIMEESI